MKKGSKKLLRTEKIYIFLFNILIIIIFRQHLRLIVRVLFLVYAHIFPNM